VSLSLEISPTGSVCKPREPPQPRGILGGSTGKANVRQINHFNPQKKSPAQTGEPGNVNQGASTIPLFFLKQYHPDKYQANEGLN